MFPLIPLANRVLVLLDSPEEERTPSGLILTSSEVSLKGVVVAVGRKVTEVSPEDRVYLGRLSGTEVKYCDKNYVVLREEDIIAKVI